MFTELIDKPVLIRAYGSGVLVGTLKEVSTDGRCVRLANCRRIHYWEGAASCSQIANDGVATNRSRIAQVTPTHFVSDAIEIIAMTENAEKNIMEAPVWQS